MQGQQSPIQSFKIFFHILSNDHKDLQTHLIDVQKSLTLDQCSTLLSQKLKKPMNNIYFKFTPDGQDLNKNQPIINIIQKDDTQIILLYENIKPILKQKQKQIKFQTISKYSFLQEKDHVKVYLPLEGIGKVADSDIHARFLDRSIEIKIFNYKGKNWIFAVPKTHNQINVKSSKIIKKDDKLIIKVAKIAENDSWFSLHKVKMVGQKELD